MTAADSRVGDVLEEGAAGRALRAGHRLGRAVVVGARSGVQGRTTPHAGAGVAQPHALDRGGGLDFVDHGLHGSHRTAAPQGESVPPAAPQPALVSKA